MVLLLPLCILLVAHFSTFAAMTALARAHDCDLYLPGGKAFDPHLQNRRLAWATAWELLALLWLSLWLGQQEGMLRSYYQAHQNVAALIQFLSRCAWLTVPLCYLVGMTLLTRVGRHLSQFSDLMMTRPDGSVLLPRNIMKPLWLALNAHGSMVLIVPPVLLMRSLLPHP